MLAKNSNILSNAKTFLQVRYVSGWWQSVAMAPPDPILGITEAHNRDSNPNKINLGVGAYRDDNGKPFILPCVREAEKRIVADTTQNHEYLPINGNNKYCDLTAKLAFGNDSPIIKDKLNVTVQGISGTGSLAIGAAFLKEHYPGSKDFYLPTPTWANHVPLFKKNNFNIKSYVYFDRKTNGFDFKGCMDSISQMPEKSIILLHACAHNPSGVDPSREEWEQMSELIKSRNLFPFFDMAYQGFASGDIDQDAYAVRLFVKHGHQIALAQSFAKNMGLYGQRVGAFSFTARDSDEAARLMSQLKLVIRPMYSNPPKYGAAIVENILGDPKLYAQWLVDVKGMADRIMSMRLKLKAGLIHDWQHIVKTKGMFCYTGLDEQQVSRLAKEFSIYLTKDGRMSIAGITSKNVDYLAHAINEVTK